MNKSDSVWPGVIFLWTWWAVETFPLPAGSGLFGALALWFVGVLAGRWASAAVFRLRARAWWLLGQLAAGYALFFWFMPLELVTRILLLWGVATPLVFVGGLFRRLYEAVPVVRRAYDAMPRLLLPALLCAALAANAWWRGERLTDSLIVAGATTALAYIPLYFGWHLGAPFPRGARDARLGTADAYRAAGMSDER